MKKEENVTVEKVTTEKELKKEQNKKLLEELTKKLEDLQKDLDVKRFLVDGGTESAKKFLNFVETKAKWKFTEVLGIVELQRVFKDFLKGGKSKEFLMGPIEIEALYYFLSKEEGIGTEGTIEYNELLKLINTPKSKMDAMRKEFEQLQFRMASVENGIDPDQVEEELKK